MKAAAAVLLALALVTPLASPPVRGACATHIAHCGLGEAALCICPDRDPAHCAWSCSQR